VIREVRFISFIIPAWNEESVLSGTLAAVNAVTQQLTEPCEVIVVDDASTDHTAEIARACGARVVPVNHRQIAATRNAGAKAARGDVFFFIDADTLIGEEVVRAALESVRCGAVGGGCALRFDGQVPPYARVLQALMVRFSRIAGIAGGCFFFLHTGGVPCRGRSGNECGAAPARPVYRAAPVRYDIGQETPDLFAARIVRAPAPHPVQGTQIPARPTKP